MLSRRSCLLGVAVAVSGCAGESPRQPAPAVPVAVAPPAAPPLGAVPFNAFLDDVARQARQQGIGAATIDAAFAGVHANERVIALDQRQPEFTQTWAQYRAARLSPARIKAGRAAYARNEATFSQISARFGVPTPVLLGIWGLESNYGASTGGFGVVEALATLGWEGRRASFFRGELLSALRILDHGDITTAHMTGSYAGAMGQPQFMPSSYLRYAVDIDGDGRRDIWASTPDVLGSIGNYLASSGWRAGQGWGEAVRVPAGLDPSLIGREHPRTLSAWRALGVRPIGGQGLGAAQSAALVMPGGAGGEGFLVASNFNAIRRYNPSDFYALAVALLGEAVLA